MSKTALIAVLFGIGLLVAIVYSTFHLAKARAEVCITFNGQTNCRIASADTQEHAVRSATTNACALIASGVTETMACEHTPPASVRFLNNK
jgi:hypothetical protein